MPRLPSRRRSAMGSVRLQRSERKKFPVSLCDGKRWAASRVEKLPRFRPDLLVRRYLPLPAPGTPPQRIAENAIHLRGLCGRLPIVFRKLPSRERSVRGLFEIGIHEAASRRQVGGDGEPTSQCAVSGQRPKKRGAIVGTVGTKGLASDRQAIGPTDFAKRPANELPDAFAASLRAACGRLSIRSIRRYGNALSATTHQETRGPSPRSEWVRSGRR